MTVALAGRAPATFEIKSANLPLVALLLKSADLQALSAELQARFGDIPDFFDHDPLVIDLTLLQEQAAEIDFAALVQLLRGYRVLPVAVRGGTASQRAAARAVGLANGDEAVVAGLRQAQAERDADADGQARTAATAARPSTQTAAAEADAGPAPPEPARRRTDAPAEAPRPDVPPPTTALVIDRPLRSGQQVYARGRDLVVMAMVNPGAEVIADGSIHVYAPLRGRAIAGARGNDQARIFSLCLEPELVSIAGVYRTSEVPLPPEVLGKPTQVRLEGGVEGRLVMEALDVIAPSPSGGGSGWGRSDAARPHPTLPRRGRA